MPSKAKIAEALAAHSSKVISVQIAAMRTPPVDVVQRAFDHKQAERYAADFDPAKLGFPLVNRRGNIWWLFDGQHRIGALKLLGFGDTSLLCEVFEDLTDEQMAHIFLGRDDRRRISPFTKFMVACTANHKRETEVRRIVESNGLRISRLKDPGCVAAVSTLLKVLDSAGSVVLGQVLRTIRDSYASEAAAFNNTVIEAFALVFNRYNGKAQERELVKLFSRAQHGVHGLLQRGRAIREKTGNTLSACVAFHIVETHNKHVPRSMRLAPWWQAGEGKAA